MLDEQFQEQCRQFRSFSKQSEKFTYLKEDFGYVISNSSSRRTRTTLRSSLSLCFTSTSLESQIDFS
jgi:hypothetical protein